MSFRNAFKIMLANFRLMWSILLYVLIVSALIGGIAFGVWYPAFREIADADYIQKISFLFNDYFSGSTEINLYQLFDELSLTVAGIGNSLLEYPARIVITFILILLFARFFLGLKDLAVAECLNARLSANMRVSFVSAYLTNFFKSWKLVLCRTLFTLPFDGAIFGATYLLMFLSRILGFRWLCPFFVILANLSLVSFKRLNFSLWPCQIVADGYRIFPSLRQSMRLSYKNGSGIYSNFLLSHAISFTFCIIVAVFTLGAGLVFLIPAGILFQSALEIALFYKCTNRRFYISKNEIIN